MVMMMTRKRLHEMRWQMGGGLWGSAPVPPAFPPSCHLPHRHRRRRHRCEQLFLHMLDLWNKFWANYACGPLCPFFAKSVFLIKWFARNSKSSTGGLKYPPRDASSTKKRNMYYIHLYKPFWTLKIWPGWQAGSGKVKIWQGNGQYLEEYLRKR